MNYELSQIIRMLYTEFDHLLPEKYAKLDLYPEGLRAEIDAMNEWVYDTVNSSFLRAETPDISV